MTPQEQDFTVRTIQLAERLLLLQDEMRRLAAERNLNGFASTITDAALADNATLKYMTQGKLTNVYVAFGAVETALGDDVSGNRTHLIKASR